MRDNVITGVHCQQVNNLATIRYASCADAVIATLLLLRYVDMMLPRCCLSALSLWSDDVAENILEAVTGAPRYFCH